MPPSQPQSQLKTYCFTINNVSPDCIPCLPSFATYVCFQPEIGESGTPHLQGYIELSKAMRISALKKLGSPWSLAHFEGRRGTQAQAIDYCRKLDTQSGPFVEYGLKARAGASKQFDLMIAEIQTGVVTRDYIRTHFLGEYIRHKRAVDELFRELGQLGKEDVDLAPLVLAEWQAKILDIVSASPHPRLVHWYVDLGGGIGKSTFTKYLVRNHGAILIDTTAKERVIRAYNNEPVVIFDISRHEGNKNMINYGIMECLKNGLGFNTMYEPGMKIWKIPHVIVFSNIFPDRSQLSADRWEISDLSLPCGAPFPLFRVDADVQF
jgi:hypothetical protein